MEKCFPVGRMLKALHKKKTKEITTKPEVLRDTKEFVKASGGKAASGISHHCYIGVQKYTYILKAEDNVMKEIREPRVTAFSRGGN